MSGRPTSGTWLLSTLLLAASVVTVRLTTAGLNAARRGAAVRTGAVKARGANLDNMMYARRCLLREGVKEGEWEGGGGDGGEGRIAWSR